MRGRAVNGGVLHSGQRFADKSTSTELASQGRSDRATSPFPPSVIHFTRDQTSSRRALTVPISDLHYEEVDFKKTGLRTVVAELRFNPILRIGIETPVAFQDRVRALLPKFSILQGAAIQFRVFRGEGEDVDVSSAEGFRPDSLTWRFQSEDDQWTASLTTNRLSLETTQYKRFPDFAHRFSILHGALQNSHPVDRFTRIGLRYINAFDPKRFPGPWLPRFNPQLVGPLADPVLGGLVTHSEQTFVLSEEDWMIKVRHGLVDGENYTLDLDHATGSPVGRDSVEDVMGTFNRHIYQVFRWSISDSFYSEMEPTSRG